MTPAPPTVGATGVSSSTHAHRGVRRGTNAAVGIAVGMTSALVLSPSPAADTAAAAPVVATAAEFRAAAAAASPGTTIRLAPGTIRGGFHFDRLQGVPGKPVVIAAADPDNPPVIEGGATGLHLTDPAHVELRDLTFTGATANGLSIDDGGSADSPAHHIVLRGLRIRDVGTKGNHDGIKLSGVTDFRVEACTVERWGTGGGSGIDMVGCHRGEIEDSRFAHTDTAGTTAANGVQAKGGSSSIRIRRNRFDNAGGRAVNIGGSTGRAFFRPPLAEGTRRAEATGITVEGNTFAGGGAAVAFVGVDGAVVRFNTIHRPGRWALRILQENNEPEFVPCRNGAFTDNLVVFRSTQWSGGGVNVGGHTAPETFSFARNFWFCEDAPARSRPSLPVAETAGVHGKDPRLRDPGAGDLRLEPDSPARHTGAEALPP